MVFLDEGTVDHIVYIKKVLPDTLKYGDRTFARHWIFQQDGFRPHFHHSIQQWCRNNFPSFIDNDCWLPNRRNWNPLDYSIWGELVNTINWNKVKSKITVIQKLKSSFKNIREAIIFQSCASWTNRLYRMCQNDGNYLR